MKSATKSGIKSGMGLGKKLLIGSAIALSSIMASAQQPSGTNARNIPEPFVDTTAVWNYQDTTRITEKDVEKLGVLGKGDIPFFMDIMGLKSPMKYMLIPVDKAYWDCAEEVSDVIGEIVKDDIEIWFAEFESADLNEKPHQIIGYVLLINLNKPEPDLKTMVKECEHMLLMASLFRNEKVPIEDYNDLLIDLTHLKQKIRAQGGKVPTLTDLASRPKPKPKPSQTVASASSIPYAAEQEIKALEIMDIDTTLIKLPKLDYSRDESDISISKIEPEALPFSKVVRTRKPKKNIEWIQLRLREGYISRDKKGEGAFDAQMRIGPVVFGAGIETKIGKGETADGEAPEAKNMLNVGLGAKIGNVTVEGVAKGQMKNADEDTTIDYVAGTSKDVFVVSQAGGRISYNVLIDRNWTALISGGLLVNPVSQDNTYELEIEIARGRFGASIFFETGEHSGKGIRFVFYPVK